ncbi:hypothetical protein CC86DRAFT_128599 [Ophiobolus disseminans]|uniref:Uncharacterized protein n=1 Tax=Ophiobolus disseminans TaxID=1469910 RepID=A0A6A6ZHV1_9PLEO|nr:hypothetical protein CC86DRAFT_128599 [Ophiobolus disseminans]
MAGFTNPSSAHALQHPATNGACEPTSRYSIPSGSCNYRDLTIGFCGCDQFWDKRHVDFHDESTELPRGNGSPSCVCGHHACYHLRASRAQEPPAFTLAPPMFGGNQGQPLPRATLDGRHAHLRQTPASDPFTQGQTVGSGRFNASGASQAHGTARFGYGTGAPSQASTSGLPPVPSVCMRSYDQPQAGGSGARYDVNQSRPTNAGLGLSMSHSGSFGMRNKQQSPSPTVADSISGAQPSVSEPEIASTRANSIANESPRVISPPQGTLDPVPEFTRNLHLDMAGDTIPNTYDPNECIPSATEVATPSIADTPDLGVADQAIQQGKVFMETLSRLSSIIQQPNGSPGRPASVTSAPSTSPAAPQEQLPHVLQAASPRDLQKLIAYLGPLHNLLNSIPNVANTMRDHCSRLEMLENGSFNFVQPEEFNQETGLLDDRINQLENRQDELDRHVRAMDADQASSSVVGRRSGNVAASFGSINSLPSTTSSAFILAAMNRKDIEMQISDIKYRLDLLEAAALPTPHQPWEIEVVMIPWGRHLRGIWFLPDESMHDTSETTTQDSEEWTQARNLGMRQGVQSPYSKAQGHTRQPDSSTYRGAQHKSREPGSADFESGWSSQAISDWASGSSNKWLFPKACGSTNLVYKRLQSRGFVRNVTLREANASDLQRALSKAFKDILEYLRYTRRDENDAVAASPGLRASFVPLRKVHKQSKLRFLTSPELSSSALWSAQFLDAGVMMKASGGKKRLFVTQRESYIQHSDDFGSTWTWQELRELPRFQQGKDSQMEGNDEHCQPQVPEADAKEACWEYMAAYDQPPADIHSSFGSHQSVDLSMRPVAQSWCRSNTPNSILKNKVVQPISPLSEFHTRPTQSRQRTASASALGQHPTGVSKRRFNSSPVKQSSAPQPTSRTPSVSMARLKRRRTTNGHSLVQDDDAPTEAQATGWNPTLRRSREPPSPFHSSQPALGRSNSDVASRASQRFLATGGKFAPFGYATPHSGPLNGGGPPFNDYTNGGDTQPNDDDEISWHGVTNSDDDADSPSIPDAGEGNQYGEDFSGGDFSAEDSGFGTESGEDDDDDDDEESEVDLDRNPRRHATSDDNSSVLNALLGAIEGKRRA